MGHLWEPITTAFVDSLSINTVVLVVNIFDKKKKKKQLSTELKRG